MTSCVQWVRCEHKILKTKQCQITSLRIVTEQTMNLKEAIYTLIPASPTSLVKQRNVYKQVPSSTNTAWHNNTRKAISTSFPINLHHPPRPPWHPRPSPWTHSWHSSMDRFRRHPPKLRLQLAKPRKERYAWPGNCPWTLPLGAWSLARVFCRQEDRIHGGKLLSVIVRWEREMEAYQEWWRRTRRRCWCRLANHNHLEGDTRQPEGDYSQIGVKEGVQDHRDNDDVDTRL